MPKVIVQLQGQDTVYPLQQGANSLGRQSSCTLPLKDTTLSRLHCEIIVAGDVATLLDKGSMNGTLLNGKKVVSQILKPGDRIIIGACTIWFEQKPTVAERREPTASVRAPAPAPARRAAPAGPPPTSRSAPTEARLAGVAELADYTFRGRSGGGRARIVAAVLVVAALAAGGVYGARFLASRTPAVVDVDNLVAANAGFDASSGGKPEKWRVRPAWGADKPSVAESVDAARGRNGGACLVLEKSQGSGELLGECGFVDDFGAGKGTLVEASAWTQFEGFSGGAAIKVDWLNKSRGAVIAEEWSDAAMSAASWTELKATFAAPPGAGAFRVGLAVMGRSGRVLFDDVSVKTRTGPPSASEKKLGAHRVVWTRQGVLQLDLRGGKRSLQNVQVRLEHEKDGATSQALASDVTSTAAAQGVQFQGRLVHPQDFRAVPVEQRVMTDEGGTAVVWQFRGEALQQVDRVSVVFSLPRLEAVRGVPEGNEPTSRATFTTDEGEFNVEFLDLPRVKVRKADGRDRLTATWTVDASMPDPAVGFRIRESGMGATLLDPIQAAADLKGQGKAGEALALLRDQAKKIKEAPVRERAETEIKALQEAEKRDWADVQARAFQARVSRRSALVTASVQALDAYVRQWGGDAGDAKSGALREEIRKEAASAPDSEADRAKRILERARAYAQSGRRTLAQGMLHSITTRFAGTESAAEAQGLLKTLSE